MTYPSLPSAPADGAAPDSAPPAGCPFHAGAEPVELHSERFHLEPYRLYEEMLREHGPVVPVELLGGLPAWLVIGYRELHQVTSDPKLFPRDVGLWNQWDNVPEGWPLLAVIGSRMPSIFNSVGTEHQRHAAMIGSALEAVDLFELRRYTEKLADRLINEFSARGTAELISEYCMPLPVLVLGWLLGFPDSEAAAVADAMRGVVDAGSDRLESGERVFQRMAALIEAKRERPGPDLASRILAHPEEFSDAEYAVDLIVIVASGHTSTADWIGNSIQLMLTEDRFAASLSAGRHSVAEAMTEVLWKDTPAQMVVGRFATRDTSLADKHIKAGDMLILGFGAANADPTIRRTGSGTADHVQAGNNAHFSFGHGEFRCPFAAQEIAEIMARTSIEVLLDRLPDLDLSVAADELEQRPAPFLRGMASLPVRFTPVSPTAGAR